MTARRPCLCGCGRLLARPKSIPLCKAATARAYELMRAIPLLDEFNAESRRSNRFWSSEETVRAALAESEVRERAAKRAGG